MRFLAAVNALVFAEATWVIEAFVTLIASVWLLACVNPLMNCQGTGGGESLVAFSAGVRSLASVDSSMF